MSPNIDSEWEPVACHRELTSVCSDPDGWDGGAVEETSKRKGIYVYTWLIRFFGQQKLAQHCKATIHQSKKEKERDELPNCEKAWEKLKCTLLSERSQSEKAKHY